MGMTQNHDLFGAPWPGPSLLDCGSLASTRLGWHSDRLEQLREDENVQVYHGRSYKPAAGLLRLSWHDRRSDGTQVLHNCLFCVFQLDLTEPNDVVTFSMLPLSWYYIRLLYYVFLYSFSAYSFLFILFIFTGTAHN